MSDHPVMRFDVTCTVWGCRSRMVYVMPVVGSAENTIAMSERFSRLYGWRIDRIGVLCAEHRSCKVGKLKVAS